MKILVLGATGGTGRLIVSDAVAKGHSVVALVRSTAPSSDKVGQMSKSRSGKFTMDCIVFVA